ncbi:MAG TPA: glycosyltransferase, partial [Rhabdaerophilum sp.]|nr:glycosyltransferase [Rhabdaerophilum sp.]
MKILGSQPMPVVPKLPASLTAAERLARTASSFEMIACVGREIRGRWIAKALDSILGQGVPVEVMVADGGSTDGTVEVLERYAPRLAHWRSHRDGGQAAAVNEAVARGTAPFVCWLNSDDWWLEGGLGRLLAALEANPSAPFA